MSRQSAVLELPPATLWFVDDEPLPELAEAIPQSLLPSLRCCGFTRTSLCCLSLAMQLGRHVESFRECRFEAFWFHRVPSVHHATNLKRVAQPLAR